MRALTLFGCDGIPFHSLRDSVDEKSIQKEVETVVVKKNTSEHVVRTRRGTLRGRARARARAHIKIKDVWPVSAPRLLRSLSLWAFPVLALLCSPRRATVCAIKIPIGQKSNSILPHLLPTLTSHDLLFVELEQCGRVSHTLKVETRLQSRTPRGGGWMKQLTTNIQESRVHDNLRVWESLHHGRPSPFLPRLPSCLSLFSLRCTFTSHKVLFSDEIPFMRAFVRASVRPSFFPFAAPPLSLASSNSIFA